MTTETCKVERRTITYTYGEYDAALVQMKEWGFDVIYNYPVKEDLMKYSNEFLLIGEKKIET